MSPSWKLPNRRRKADEGLSPTRSLCHPHGRPSLERGTARRGGVAPSCYRRSLEIAAANGITSLAFPGVSTGIYGYPIEPAAKVAINSVRATLAELTAIREVTFCCFSPNDLAVYQGYLVGT